MNTASSKTTVIVVHYGETSPTQLCLEALGTLIDYRPHIIVVSNGPQNANSQLHEYITSLPESDINLIISQANLGYAGAANIGIQAAIDGDSDFIWLLNNDTVPEPSSLNELLHCAVATENKSVLGTTLVDMNRPDRIQVAGGCGYQASISRMSPRLEGKKLSKSITRTTVPFDYIHGASIFLPVSIIHSCGLLNDKYFLYYEELDFCRRVLKAGYTLHWCSQAIVRHQNGGSIKKVKIDDFQEYHENRSTILFTKTHHPLLLPLVIGIRLLSKLFLYAKRGHLRRIPTLLMAIRDGLTGNLRKTP